MLLRTVSHTKYHILCNLVFERNNPNSPLSFKSIVTRVPNDMAGVYYMKSMQIIETNFGVICIPTFMY
jgi:hypothetical protein